MQAQKKLLIVEDDPLVATIYRTRLEKEGYLVEVAEDGQAGFYRIHEYRPDAVLLDLMLPHINGVDILKKIRAQRAFEKLPILVFTNAYFREMIQDAMQAGATKVFHKATLTPKQIIEAIDEALFSKSGPPPAPMAAIEPTTHPAAEPATVVPATATAPVAATAPAIPTGPTHAQAAFEADLRQTFFTSGPEKISTLRRTLQNLVKAGESEARMPLVNELYRRVHSITGSAAITGLGNILQVASCLEALLKELAEKPRNITASTYRTVANGIDFLGTLVERGDAGEVATPPPHCILVVDDEIISRKAVVFALERASLKAIAVEDPNLAYTLLLENHFDLVIFDIDMPGLNGLELCKKMRALPACKETPAIFVTSLSDFESRAQSTISGGNDLIAKPFVFTELAAKALMYVIRGRIARVQPAAS